MPQIREEHKFEISCHLKTNLTRKSMFVVFYEEFYKHLTLFYKILFTTIPPFFCQKPLFIHHSQMYLFHRTLEQKIMDVHRLHSLIVTHAHKDVYSGLLLQILSIKQCHLAGPRKHEFFVTAPILWNSIPFEIQVSSTLIDF